MPLLGDKWAVHKRLSSWHLKYSLHCRLTGRDCSLCLQEGGHGAILLQGSGRNFLSTDTEISVLAWQNVGWVILWIGTPEVWAFLMMFKWEGQLQPALVNLSLENTLDIFWVPFSWLSPFPPSTELHFLLAIGSASAYPLLLPWFACSSQWLLHFLVLSPSTLAPLRPILTEKVSRWCPSICPLHQHRCGEVGKQTLLLPFSFTLLKKIKKKTGKVKFFLSGQSFCWLEKSQDFIAKILLYFLSPVPCHYILSSLLCFVHKSPVILQWRFLCLADFMSSWTVLGTVGTQL